MQSQPNRGWEIFFRTSVLVGGLLSLVLLAFFDRVLFVWTMAGLTLLACAAAVWIRHRHKVSPSARKRTETAAALVLTLVFYGALLVKLLLDSIAVEVMLLHPDRFVPRHAPADPPEWVYDPAQLHPVPNTDGLLFAPGVVLITFSSKSLQRHRQRVIDSASARVIGGARYGDDGDYFVELQAAQSWDVLSDRSEELERDWRVALATPVTLRQAGRAARLIRTN